jgi:hypothetical protein
MLQDRHNTLLSTQTTYDTISVSRKVEIFSQMVRHTTALILLIAELCLGFKPKL